jgi:DNA end-binding protein Ku
MATRAYWSGRIRLALVSIPVEVFPATKSSSRISFHQIHEPSGKRIRYEKVVPGLGAIDTDDIVKGYEVEKGKYVLLSDEEIDEVKLEAKKSIELVQFVDEKDIDPIYIEKPFFVLPSGENEDAEEAYTVLREALRKTKKVGLGQLVVRGQSSIVAIRPSGKGLMMETLRYSDEVKRADETFDDISEKSPDKDLLELGEELIQKKSAKFQPEKFKDQYTVALKELIAAKREKRAPREIEAELAPSNVVNLMDALKRSVKGETRRSANDNRVMNDNKPAKSAKRGKTRAKAAKSKTVQTKSARKKNKHKAAA